MNTKYIEWFENLGMHDVGTVGGKNASLGEMIQNLASAGITVPNGFATTADAFWVFLKQSGLDEKSCELLHLLLDGLFMSTVMKGPQRTARQYAQLREFILDAIAVEAGS